MTTVFLCLATLLLGYLIRSWRIERLTRERDDALVLAARHQDNVDDALVDLAAETRAHAETKRALAEAKQAAADHYAALCVVLDAHARDIVLDPLGSDLIADESLALVKGGQS